MSKKPSIVKPRSAKCSKETGETITNDVIVYGLDPNGKPKAARFRGDVRDQVVKAAASLKYQVMEPSTPDQVEISRKLPFGRIAARGPAFIPYIKRDIFDRIVFLSGAKASSASTPKVPRLPPDWKSIAAGDLVLVYEGQKEGWWECIVLERKGDNLRVQSWEFPKYPPFDCTMMDVGLANPNIPETALIR